MDSNFALKRGEAWADGEPVGEELLALFLARLIPPNADPDPGNMSLSWFHSIRSSGEIFCTSRRISPMPIKSVNASRPAGVVGTSLGAPSSGSLGSSGGQFSASSRGSSSTCSLFAPSFSFSSFETRFMTAFVLSPSLDRPGN